MRGGGGGRGGGRVGRAVNVFSLAFAVNDQHTTPVKKQDQRETCCTQSFLGSCDGLITVTDFLERLSDVGGNNGRPRSHTISF